MRNKELVSNMVLRLVKPILEDWSKIKLMIKVGLYGFRRYLRGSILRMHVDRLPTHILSAILQVRPGLRFLETLGGSWILMKTHGDSWSLIEAHGDSWGPMHYAPDTFKM